MSKTPYEYCIFTIKAEEDLDTSFEKGGSDSFTEGRRWVTAQQYKKDADKLGQSLLVLFADAGSVEHILYSAVLEKIEVALEGNETKYTFTDQRILPYPPLHKTDLLMVDGQNVSEGHIRPYVLCRTPDILRLSDDELFDALLAANSEGGEDEGGEDEGGEDFGESIEESDEEDTEGEELDVEGIEPRVMHLGNTRIECYELLSDLASALPRDDSQMLADLRSTETGEAAWDEVSILLIHAALEGQYNLQISEAEVARCETVGDLISLVRSKIQ